MINFIIVGNVSVEKICVVVYSSDIVDLLIIVIIMIKVVLDLFIKVNVDIFYLIYCVLMCI